MSRDDRVDTIDLIINVLKEHEKNLDTQIAKLENIMNADKTASPSQGEAKFRVKVTINKWFEFCEKSREPQMLTFNVSDDKLEVFALKDDIIYVYREKIPKFLIGSEIAKSWISKELGIEGASIIFGSIET